MDIDNKGVVVIYHNNSVIIIISYLIFNFSILMNIFIIYFCPADQDFCFIDKIYKIVINEDLLFICHSFVIFTKENYSLINIDDW